MINRFHFSFLNAMLLPYWFTVNSRCVDFLNKTVSCAEIHFFLRVVVVRSRTLPNFHGGHTVIPPYYYSNLRARYSSPVLRLRSLRIIQISSKSTSPRGFNKWRIRVNEAKTFRATFALRPGDCSIVRLNGSPPPRCFAGWKVHVPVATSSTSVSIRGRPGDVKCNFFYSKRYK